ncbi:hypothetical protein [Pseudoalteromonas sp. MMG024]|uniref:hypothetical protein n=1 Tax=Pseudoalteromonas sp. MMG024 TaxID=2909980 RepID=UPI001F1653B5|nr:hypothetical protein [Pseudoalteromonas sp. MMG024]MCF6456113.1 hypothetical protein [Pseudoalteromonas sp. MMG024]
MNLEAFYQDYTQAKSLKDKNESHHLVRKIVGRIASNFPKDNPDSLAWFTAALMHPEKKWFVVKLLEKVNPLPKALFDDLVFASLIEHDPSFNKWFIKPCVKSFGIEAVKSKIMSVASHPQVVENEGVNKVMYWVR